jgi:hypothetical protein
VRFGAVEALRDPVAAAEARVGWERILFYWSELQPNGPEEWNGYHVPDIWLNLAAEQGRQVVGLLKHTPAWATGGPVGCGVPRGLDLPIDDPGNLWASFVRRAVSIYAGRIDRWIIWNEPDIVPPTYGYEWCGSMEEYYQLLKVAYLAARQVNPDATIHLAGMTTWHDKSYLRRFLALATADPSGSEHGYYFDVVSLHIYFRTESVPEIINETQATLAAYGLSKPVWVNETNAPPNSDPQWPMGEANYSISLEEQASFLLQSFALALSAGAERVAVYKWLDNDLPPGFEPFGLIRPDYSRRPAYDAYRLITTHYRGTVSAKEDRRSLHTVVTLDRRALTTRVLWARTQAEATATVPALASQARLVDQTGAEQAIEPVDGQYTVTLPGAPCTDKRGCIIGGATYLLVEETSGTVSPTATGVPAPEGTAVLTPTAVLSPTVSVSPDAAPTVSPTASPTLMPPPTETSTQTPTATVTPTDTPTTAPTATPSATPTSTATPSPTPLPSETPMVPTAIPTSRPAISLPAGVAPRPALVALVSLVASVVVFGVWFRRRNGR